MPRNPRQTLRRDLGLLGNFAFAYGDVAEGIYFTLGLVLLYAGSAATYAYLFATMAYVLTALCYAELSSSITSRAEPSRLQIGHSGETSHSLLPGRYF